MIREFEICLGRRVPDSIPDSTDELMTAETVVNFHTAYVHELKHIVNILGTGYVVSNNDANVAIDVVTQASNKGDLVAVASWTPQTGFLLTHNAAPYFWTTTEGN